jgi:predicted RNA-binding protein with PUA-like domain
MVKGTDVKFGIDDLAQMGVSMWDGVVFIYVTDLIQKRNYEARNLLRDRIKCGDSVLFYHSNCKTPGVAGLAEVVKSGYPDPTAFDPQHPYFDSKPTDTPRWFTVRNMNELD